MLSLTAFFFVSFPPNKLPRRDCFSGYVLIKRMYSYNFSSQNSLSMHLIDVKLKVTEYRSCMQFVNVLYYFCWMLYGSVTSVRYSMSKSIISCGSSEKLMVCAMKKRDGNSGSRSLNYSGGVTTILTWPWKSCSCRSIFMNCELNFFICPNISNKTWFLINYD